MRAIVPIQGKQVAYLLGLTPQAFRRLTSSIRGKRLPLPSKPTGAKTYVFQPLDVMAVRAEYLAHELPDSREVSKLVKSLRSLRESALKAFVGGRGKSVRMREIKLLKALLYSVDSSTPAYAFLQVVVARHEMTSLSDEVEQCIPATNLLTDLGLARRAAAILRDEIETCNMLAADLERLDAGAPAEDVPQERLVRYKLAGACRLFSEVREDPELLAACRTAIGMRGRLYGSLSLALESLSEFSFAQQATADALKLARQHGDKRTEAIATKQAGDLARVQGRQEEAIVEYHKALELYRKISFPAHKIWSGLGLASWELANTDQALQWLEKALEAYTTTYTADVAGTATARLNLGSLLFTTGEIHDAGSHFEEAVRLSMSDGGRLHTQIIARINLGNCLEVIGNNENAIREYLQACSLAERMHNAWLASYARMLAADLQQSDILVNVKHDIEQAQKAVQRKMADHWTVPFVLLKRARICIKSKDFDLADKLLHAALDTARYVGMPAFRLIDIHVELALLNLGDDLKEVQRQVSLAEQAWTKFKGAHQEILILAVRFCVDRQITSNPDELKPQLDYMEGLVNKLGLLPTSGLARAVAFCRHVMEHRQGQELAADPLLGYGRRW